MRAGRKSSFLIIAQYGSSISLSITMSLPAFTAAALLIVLIFSTALTSLMIPTSCGSITCAPSSQYALYPLYCGGLCDAVTTTPVCALSLRIANESSGVGRSDLKRYAVIPLAAKMRAVASANLSEFLRLSYATTALRVPFFAFAGKALIT